MTDSGENPAPSTTTIEPTWVIWVMSRRAPITTDTALDATLPLYGLLTTWNVPGPIAVPAGTVTCNELAVPPGCGVSGPTKPDPVNRLTSGALNPEPPIVATAPGTTTVSTAATGTVTSSGCRPTPLMLRIV